MMLERQERGSEREGKEESERIKRERGGKGKNQDEFDGMRHITAQTELRGVDFAAGRRADYIPNVTSQYRLLRVIGPVAGIAIEGMVKRVCITSSHSCIKVKVADEVQE
jgi:hypothetical protein